VGIKPTLQRTNLILGAYETARGPG
jgi:hypothetical protein